MQFIKVLKLSKNFNLFFTSIKHYKLDTTASWQAFEIISIVCFFS